LGLPSSSGSTSASFSSASSPSSPSLGLGFSSGFSRFKTGSYIVCYTLSLVSTVNNLTGPKLSSINLSSSEALGYITSLSDLD